MFCSLLEIIRLGTPIMSRRVDRCVSRGSDGFSHRVSAAPLCKVLSCQSGSWSKSASAGTITPLYLVSSNGVGGPSAACPSGWAELDYRSQSYGAGARNVRTCIPSSGQSCSVLYLEASIAYGAQPNNCPTAWVEADYQNVYSPTPANQTTLIRSCYKC